MRLLHLQQGRPCSCWFVSLNQAASSSNHRLLCACICIPQLINALSYYRTPPTLHPQAPYTYESAEKLFVLPASMWLCTAFEQAWLSSREILHPQTYQYQGIKCMADMQAMQYLYSSAPAVHDSSQADEAGSGLQQDRAGQQTPSVLLTDSNIVQLAHGLLTP